MNNISEENSITLDTFRYNCAGNVPAIVSKSYAHRYIILAALAKVPSRIICKGTSKDIEATIGCMNSLGADIRRDGDALIINPISYDRASNEESESIDVGESGSTLRFMLPVIGALGRNVSITMHGRLPERPLSPLYEEMEDHNVSMSEQGSNPFHISGQMTSGDYTIAGNISSQFITGLLMSLPLLDGDSRIIVTGKMESRPYIDITLDVLRKMGITITEEAGTFIIKGGQIPVVSEDFVVEGDWSNAAFFLCLGAMGKKPVTVSGLNPLSEQGDRKILDILNRFGAFVSIIPDDDKTSSVTVSPGALKGIDIDAADIPDLVPIISAVAAIADGTTTIRNIERLRIKESDRVQTVIDTLSKLGADIREVKTVDDSTNIKDDNDNKSYLEIRGKKSLSGGTVDSHNDHRIAMTAAILSAVSEGPVTINNCRAVEKSYPNFYEELSSLCKF